ncbi:tesmin TSO1-like CXC domain protein (macronuclear) [Tetrahymena thermophila SB210]|uniref:Tesmin TSO1-like CXC domain protein n=1 Tax=Tetrahymena thermophila (strain SB210) TaxID=312017 RepID=Q24BW0_TETTS|nr:tesmin TSO1-like CXC domain protein [Tetrahymena thermophila SB210]EAS05277.2 tesmin TSO1-like CXC domain protein [Tetrahymena thermophila SB210]|eukprot:XP_001025522.2 tesmin TSO1-like CXC domain protein [Tetrahymena thermophila SB210]
MKNNYFDNNSHKQQQQQFISTPCKNDKFDLSDDQILNSNRKIDDPFHSYCQNNLSPINNFQFMAKTHFMASPIQQNNKSYKNMKNVFSPAPVSHNAQYGKYPPIGYNPVHMIPPPIHHHEYGHLQKDEFDSDYHQHYPHGHKAATTPVISKQQPIILLNGKPANYPSSKLSHFANQPLNENHSNYYVYQSPVFKMTFNNKNQFEKFIDSDFNKVYVDDFQLQSCGTKQVIPKPQDSENENHQISYKRVIQFHDENDDECQEEQRQDEKNQKKSGPSIMNAKNPVKKGDVQNSHKSYNLFEENNNIQQNAALFDSQNTQMTFNPYKNSQSSQISDNATTVKKNTDLQIQSSDFIQTAEKPQQQQKRKLFESPQRNDDRDLHTPSTKKKSSQLLTGNNQITSQLSKKKEDKVEQKKQSKKDKLLQLENEQIQLSSKKAESQNIEEEEEEEENLKNPPIEKSTAEKEDDHENMHEDEDHIEKQSNSSGDSNLAPYTAQNSSIKPANHAEDRKICCNCKRTKCLKLYCECFAASRMCEGCTCQGCFNKPEFEAMRKEARQAILERNNSAFDPKIDSQSKLKQLCNEEGVDNEQKVHSKGCNCKKSNCLKKYCECYQLGVKCTKLCKCDNCRNNINHPHSHEEPDSRLNATPSASNILTSTGKVPQNHRSQPNQLNLAQNEYSQYNQYNYYYGQENYQPYYYQLPYPYYYNDYYMINQEEQGENSAGPHILSHYEHPYQYGYDHYNFPQGPHQQNGKNSKKYPPQYPQSAYQYEQLSNRKRGLKQGNYYDEQQYYDNYGYPYMPYPEKKRKQAPADEKLLDAQNIVKESNDELGVNKEISDQQVSKQFISPRFKENSMNEIQEEQQVQIKKEEIQFKKDQKIQKIKLEYDSSIKQKLKKEEIEQVKTINEAIEEENLENGEQIEENQNSKSLEEQDLHQQQIENLQQSDAEEDIESEEIQNTINQKTKKQPAKKEDKKSKKSKKENVSLNVEITKSPHNTRKNQNSKIQEDKPKQQASQKQSAKKAAVPTSSNKKKDKKSIQKEEVEEKQLPSSNSKRSNSKKQKNVS